MKIEPSDGMSGTCLQGYLEAPYETLVTLLGPPSSGDGHKTDVEWHVKIDGVPVTVYNYKDGKSHLGSGGTAAICITNWHIGGIDKEAVAAVKKLFLPYKVYDYKTYTEKGACRIG